MTVTHPFQQHFFIEGKHFGTAARSRVWVHGELQAPRSLAYFCPKCAEIWARCPVVGEWSNPDWAVLSMHCKKHNEPTWQVSGSLSINWDKEYVDAFPEAVLQWELQRHFDYYDYTHKGKV